jgi:hypothetical protein
MFVRKATAKLLICVRFSVLLIHFLHAVVTAKDGNSKGWQSQTAKVGINGLFALCDDPAVDVAGGG